MLQAAFWLAIFAIFDFFCRRPIISKSNPLDPLQSDLDFF